MGPPRGVGCGGLRKAGVSGGRGPRCFPRGYYELSVPGRRPGTFRAPPPPLRAGAGETGPPSPRPPGTPCTSPSPPRGCALKSARLGLGVPAAAPPPGLRSAATPGLGRPGGGWGSWGEGRWGQGGGKKAEAQAIAAPSAPLCKAPSAPRASPRATRLARSRRHLRVSVLRELLLPGLGGQRRLLRLQADLAQLLHHLLVLLILHGVQAAVVAIVHQPFFLEAVPRALHGPVLALADRLKHGCAGLRAGLRGACKLLAAGLRVPTVVGSPAPPRRPINAGRGFLRGGVRRGNFQPVKLEKELARSWTVEPKPKPRAGVHWRNSLG